MPPKAKKSRQSAQKPVPHNSATSPANVAQRSSTRSKRKLSTDNSVPKRLRTVAGSSSVPVIGISEGASTIGQNAEAAFENAHDFVIKNLNSTQINVRNGRSDETLQWLKEYTMPGAEHDSADRVPPPRCHPGTRTTIIQRVEGWSNNPQPEKKLLWLRGPAGVGKSAIIQTIVENLVGVGHLGASLFFSRPNGRTNPWQIFPTLAYQFAVQDPSYKTYITQLMLTNPEVLNKAMSEQFRILIIEPFVHKEIRSGSGMWVVALDGLDECGGDPNGGRHGDRVQCEIVRLISNFVLEYPAVPLVWIIASRPETHLKAVFLEEDVVPSFWEEEILVDSDEACRDVEKFLHQEFVKVRQNYPDHIHETPWPSHNSFLKIAHAALGLFIFAEVIIRFIDDPSVGNPIGQLDCVVSVISKMPLTRNQENPLAALDAIYITILSKIPPSMLQVTKRLVGSFIFLETDRIKVSDCDFRRVCNYLDITRDTALTALRYLHSVLHFRNAKDIGSIRPRFYHASFRDFLEDPSRSHEYFIERQPIATELFHGVIRIVQTQFISQPVVQPSWPGNGRVRLPEGFISDCLWSLLGGDASSDDVQIPFHGTTCFLSSAQLRLLFESLSAVKLIEYVWELCEYLIDAVLEVSKTRTLGRGMMQELKTTGFFSWTTLGSLDIDWDTVNISIIPLTRVSHRIHLAKRASRFHCIIHKFLSILKKESPEDVRTPRRNGERDLRYCFEAAPQMKVIVLGRRESGSFMVVREQDISGVWNHKVQIRNYVLTGAPLRTT